MELKTEKLDNVIDEINYSRTFNLIILISRIVTIGLIVLGLALMSITKFALVIVLVFFIVQFFIPKRKFASLEYDLLSLADKGYDEVKSSYFRFVASRQILGVQNSREITQAKVGAPPFENIPLTDISCQVISSNSFFRCNTSFMQITYKKITFMFLPDVVFIVMGRKSVYMFYPTISFSFQEVNYVEHGQASSDTNVLFMVSRYDESEKNIQKKYKKEVLNPVCAYGMVKIKLAENLRIDILCSNKESSKQFVDKINEYKTKAI